MRQVLVEKGYPSKLVDLMKIDDASDRFDAFVAARILLHCAGDKNLDLVPYFECAGLAEAVNASVSRYGQTPGPPTAGPISADGENLKLLSTLLTRYPAQAPGFLESLDPILEIFDRATISSPPLEHPMSSLINCLVTIPSLVESPAGRRLWSSLNDRKLVELLDAAVRFYELVKISTEEVTPHLKNALGSLLMTLSDGDPQQLIRNVGYGCASGLLFTLGMPIPPADGEGQMLEFGQRSISSPASAVTWNSK
ncbi:hypothetical protein DV736_g6570, partial [Chaetothyriales sp. CBS 134916]